MRLAINGYGRVGRCLLRAWHEREDTQSLSMVAINELASHDAIAYLTQYDSTHGRFPADVSCDVKNQASHTGSSAEQQLLINSIGIDLLQQADQSQLPWQALDIDLVMECTGKITTVVEAKKHIDSGAKRVLLSNPGEALIPALVYGVNHQPVNTEQRILSAASCTSNALVPVLSVLDKTFGVENGVVTTIHASMHDQPVIDAYHSQDLRRNRAASQSIIPVDTALAQGIDRVLPNLQGKFVAHALRVPVNNVSALNVTINLRADVTEAQINDCLKEAAENALVGVLGYTEALLASCDFNHDARSGVIDANQTRVSAGRTVNVLIWFDNEWAFANRMLDLALFLNDQ
ncbi:MAG: erythrose-4-phosphate dehydrogenase [Cellvibrionales bacterium]|jgi:D-erythrose 4-phosphate dehydrogenase|nr:erythrose-4-phosphate dehydrogenase [Cellvibrionales bacterium]